MEDDFFWEGWWNEFLENCRFEVLDFFFLVFFRVFKFY